MTGSNGGTGFSAWTLTSSITSSSDFAGEFIGSSMQLSNTAAGIDTSGDSFGMYGQIPSGSTDTAYADAYRSFNGGALALGQTFSFDLAVNYRNGAKGVDLFSSGTTVFNFNVAGDDYAVNNATTGDGSVGNTYDGNTAFHFSFTQTSTTDGTWTIVRSGGVTSTTTGTYTGDLDQFHLYVNNTGEDGSADNLYAPTFEIVPEPGTWGILLMGGLGALMVIQRRKSLVD